MPPREWRHRVDDILSAIAKMLRYTQGMTFEEFLANDMAMDAVRLNIFVIGEAASNLPPEVQELAPAIPWAKMRGMRNRVAHEYWGIDLEIIWGVVTDEVQPLIQPLQELLEQYPETAGDRAE